MAIHGLIGPEYCLSRLLVEPLTDSLGITDHPHHVAPDVLLGCLQHPWLCEVFTVRLELPLYLLSPMTDCQASETWSKLEQLLTVHYHKQSCDQQIAFQDQRSLMVVARAHF